MKKTIIFFLLFAGTANVLPAQFDLPEQSELLFNNPKPGRANAVFNFYLADHRRAMFEFTHISQIDYLPNLDSLVKAAFNMLAPLKDSLKADGMVRRVDMFLGNNIPKIRILTHAELLNSFTVKDNELMQLKVNQDTIRIIAFAKSRLKTVWSNNGIQTLKEDAIPFVITLILNNVEDMATLEPDALTKCLSTLRPNLSRYSNWGPADYRAEFDMKTGKMISPVNINSKFSSGGQNGFDGVLGFSLSAVRGSVVPSIQAGFAYNRSHYYYTNSYRLYLEGQYFFSRDAGNKLITDRNTFINFQFIQTTKQTDMNRFSFEGNLTFGYLIRRTGNWYEPTTFKLGLPVLKNKHISIEPQLIFNGFFKNVTPSIKLTFNF